MRAVAVLALALVAVGCSQDREDPVAPTPVPDQTTAERRRSIVLEGDALVLAVDDENIDRLEFETARLADTTTKLEERLGDSTQGVNSECGGGPLDILVFSGRGLTVYFSNDVLAGWSVTEGGDSHVTKDNIAIGTTRDELQEIYDGEVEIGESSLGIEWTAPDGISGLLTEDAPTGKVEVFWSGATCIAR